ncbi:hypothetical protein ABKV60_22670, partial (plasmid) [Enterobacter hormaechei]
RKNAPDDSGATAWLCTDIPGRDFSGENPMNALKATTNHPDTGERMRNLLRGREALPAQPENPFSARSGRGAMYELFRERI